MKLKITLLCLLAAYTALAKPIIIKGKINGKLPDNLYYSAPVNGSLGFLLCYSAPMDVNGNFEIKADSDAITFIDVYYDFQPAGYIVAQPGGVYNINITENQGSITNQVTGTDTEMQKRYNQVVANTHREMPFYEVSMEAVKIESLTEFNAFFESKLEADLKALDINNKNVIPAAAAKALVSERNYFYACAKAYALLLKHLKAGNTPANLAPFSAEWKAVYEKFGPADAAVQKDPCGWHFLDGYKNFRQFEAAGFDKDNVTHNNDQSLNVKQNAALIPTQNTEYYYAATLHNFLVGSQKQKFALSVFNNFKAQYPTSGYTSFLEDDIAPVVAFFAQNNALPQGASYVEGYATVNSLDELIKKFPGQKLYVDVWATTCGPCRQEFKHKEALYKLLEANNIKVVYISIDEDNKDETWKKMISHYSLEGYHVRASQPLVNNLRALFNKNYGIAIPWYILASNGTIATKHAPPPSDLAKLEAEIKKL